MVKVFLAQEGGRGKEIGVTRINLQPSFIGIQSNSVADSSVGSANLRRKSFQESANWL